LPNFKTWRPLPRTPGFCCPLILGFPPGSARNQRTPRIAQATDAEGDRGEHRLCRHPAAPPPSNAEQPTRPRRHASVPFKEPALSNCRSQAGLGRRPGGTLERGGCKLGRPSARANPHLPPPRLPRKQDNRPRRALWVQDPAASTERQHLEVWRVAPPNLLGTNRQHHSRTVNTPKGAHRNYRSSAFAFSLNNFKHCLTLSSKFFSSFPHGTCSLSVSRTSI